jgi:DNA-binding transcriptional ArsR family regulator
VKVVEEKGATGSVRPETEGVRPEVGHIELLKALAHETRLQILGILSYRDLSPAELARQRAEPVSKVAYHFRLLEELGCARVVRTRRVRGSVEHFYRRTGIVVFDEDAWAELPPEVREVVTGTAAKELIGRMARAITAGTFDSHLDRHFTWRALALDDRGWEEMTAALNAAFEEISAIEARAEERLQAGDEKPVLATVAMAGFESPTD